MKKLYFIGALLLMAVSMNAQISLWETGKASVWSDAQQQWVDSAIARIALSFDYSEVDSISIKVNKNNQAHFLYLWKNDNIVSAKGYIAGTGTNVSNSYYPIDSIVWHPYKLKNAWLSYQTNMPVANLYGQQITYGFPVGLEPKYAPFTYELTNSNPEVAQVKIEKQFTRDYTYGMIWETYLNISPLQMGTTTITVTFDNSIVRSFNLEVGPRTEMQDEVDLALDSLFNKIYSRLAQTGDMLPVGRGDLRGMDEAMSGFARGLVNLQDLCADQVFWIWQDPGIADVATNNLTAKNALSDAFFRRLYYNIWLCNSYLHRSEGQSALAAERAEVRFLRAFFYYYLLDMYGNVPIITDNTQYFYTPQSTRSQLYQFVEAELLAAETDLLEPASKTDYYRVDKAAAWLLLSRLYLNGAVYAGADDYTKAAQYAHKVITSSYGMASNYKWLFMGDNDKRSTVNDAWKEIILPVRQEGSTTASYGGSIFQVASMSHEKMPSIGLAQNWYCILSRAQLPKLFFADPASAAKGTAEALTAAAGDDRALFCNSNNGQNWNYNNLTYANFFSGWAIQKWSNLMADNSYLPSSTLWPDTDIPLMRKAEAYLNYAEAVLRGGTPVQNYTALQAVNTVRNRAHASPLSGITLSVLLDERGREFYTEGYRRTDLIRFGKFGGNTGYPWEWKNNVHNGSNFPAYMNLYPIPASVMDMMYQAVQNEGY